MSPSGQATPRQPPSASPKGARSELHLRCLPGGSHPCRVPSVSPLCPLWLQATARSPPKAAPAGTGTRGKRGSLAVPVAGCHQGRDPHRAPTSWGHGCGCSLGGTQVGAGLGSGSVLSPWVLSHPSHCPHSHLRGRMGMWHPKLIAPFLGREGGERTTYVCSRTAVQGCGCLHGEEGVKACPGGVGVPRGASGCRGVPAAGAPGAAPRTGDLAAVPWQRRVKSPVLAARCQRGRPLPQPAATPCVCVRVPPPRMSCAPASADA